MIYDRKIAFHTLGCKLNFSETSTIARQAEDAGFARVNFTEIADFYVINTCSVTENADKKCRAVVRQVLSRAPNAKVIMIGCYAQLKPQQIAEIPGVSLVLGAGEKFNLSAYLDQLAKEDATKVVVDDIKQVNTYEASFSQTERTRTFLKVQDGCDYFCSFCTIPLARGRSRSQSIEETLKVARQAARGGVKEIVLTGVNIGDFGKTPDGRSRTKETLLDLVKELELIPGIERWRISSIEPNLLTEELIEFVAGSDKFMPHFHIPLQSGSNEILRLMRRKYERELYESRVRKIREILPEASIGVDVIVGFPGETKEHFLETYDFLNELDISYLHVFTYSERANTRALDIKPVIPIKERRERSQMLRILSQKKSRAFYDQFSGMTKPVLFEAENDDGFMYGFTDNYVKVRYPYKESWINTVQQIELADVSSFGYMHAEITNKNLALAAL